MTQTANPIDILNSAKMSRVQVVVVIITVFLNALDGFDILSISFAAPGFAREWEVSKAVLGVVLSMELVGMGFGALILGGLADNKGRRFAGLACLCLMSLGMLGSIFSYDIMSMSASRIVTGLGIGGMLAATNAIVSEFANSKQRRLCISFMVMGFSAGGMIGGFAASKLLAHYDWRSVFYLGFAVTTLFIPIFYFLVPESVHWLARKRPENALAKINTTLSSMGHPPISALPELSEENKKGSIADIFSPQLIRGTLLVSGIYLLHSLTFYFTLKWVPKIVVDLGFHPSAAGSVLVWSNVGATIGGIIFGVLAIRYHVKWLLFGALIFSSLAVIGFGNSASDLVSLSIYCAASGFFSVSSLVGLYAIMAHIYPTHTRGFGTGFTLSFGRGGAIFSPILAGLLFTMDLTLPVVGTVMGMGSLLGAALLLFLHLKPQGAD